MTRSRDADVEQEGGHVGRLPGQDLLDEVVGDRAQVAGQLADGHIEVTAALQRQRGQPQAGRPPLRPVHQGLQLPGRQLDALTFEQADGLGVVQAEVGGPQLGQLPRQPQPLQRQRQVGTGGQDRAQAAGAAPQGVGQGPQRRGADELVPVVQHQCGGPGERLAGRQQPGDEAPVEGRWGRHRGERARGRDSPGALQRRQHVPPEARGVRVLPLQRQPRGPAGTTGRPGGEHQRLARAGRRRDGDRASADTVLDDVVEAGPGHEARWDHRDAGACLLHPGPAPRHATGCRTGPLRLGHVHLPSGRAQGVCRRAALSCSLVLSGPACDGRPRRGRDLRPLTCPGPHPARGPPPRSRGTATAAPPPRGCSRAAGDPRAA